MKKIFCISILMHVALAASAQSCPDDNHPHAIDLGLPSGTKWACCNVGADKPEAYGGYYAWGETEEKSTYNWSTCHNLGSDIAGTQYDVAHVMWGGFWVMSSLVQIKELLNNCTNEWTTLNGVKGKKFTGKNGGTIFMPLAGYRWREDLIDDGYVGYYWSSTQDPSYSDNAYRLYFSSDYASWNSNYRFFGLSVRPVTSGTNNINLLESSSEKASQAIYNIYGLKVDGDNLKPGVYIQGGKKYVVR